MTTPTSAFMGLRRRDHAVRYVSTAAYSALALTSAALTAKALSPEALTLQALPSAEVAVNFLGTAAASAAAYGWMRTCDVFNAIKNRDPIEAEMRAVNNNGAISTIASGTNNILATTLPFAALLSPTVTLTQLAIGAVACALFTRTTQLLGRSHIRMLAIETGHPAHFRMALGEKGVNQAFEQSNQLHRARNRLG